MFEIFVDGKLKFSKQALGRFPTDAEIDALSRRRNGAAGGEYRQLGAPLPATDGGIWRATARTCSANVQLAEQALLPALRSI